MLRALLDMSTTAQIKDSLKLGGEVLRHIGQVGHLHKGSVEQAGFAVLKAPDIPSILVETAFISNPEEEAQLRDRRVPGQAGRRAGHRHPALLRQEPAAGAAARAVAPTLPFHAPRTGAACHLGAFGAPGAEQRNRPGTMIMAQMIVLMCFCTHSRLPNR